MRVSGTAFLAIALIGLSAPASASDPLPQAGSAKLAAYLICRPLAAIDMGAVGSATAIECDGIVKNLESQKAPDNLAIHCLEDTSARPEGYKYSGTCVQTDGDSDKIFMTYEGLKTGEIRWIGGTGKYKDITGAGSLNVTVAPGASATLFAYTLTYDVNWTSKAK